jgi:hypothetical protein
VAGVAARLVVALATLVGAACSAPDDAPASAPDRGSDGGALDGGAFEPIDGMRATSDRTPIGPEDVARILHAEQRLIAACMGDEGFDYDVTPWEDVVTQPPAYLSPDELRDGGYRYDWAGAAASFLALNGPDGPPEPTAGMSEDEAAAYTSALGGTGRAVMLDDPAGGAVGYPADGCGAEAQIELYGSVANDIRFERALDELSTPGTAEELQTMDALREPLAAWQACMRRAGHDVPPTADYGATWLQQVGVAALSEQGEGQAVVTADVIADVERADADCQESSGLFEVRQELLPAARQRIAERLGFELPDYVAFQHAVLDRAERVP